MSAIELMILNSRILQNEKHYVTTSNSQLYFASCTSYDKSTVSTTDSLHGLIYLGGTTPFLHRADAKLVSPQAQLAGGPSITPSLHADAVVAALPQLGLLSCYLRPTD